MGLSIDGDDDDEPRDGAGGGVDLTLRSAPSPKTLLAYGSDLGATLRPFSLAGGSSSSHGVSSSHTMSIHGVSSHGFSGHGYSSHSVGGMPRVLSWHGGMSPSDAGLDGDGEAVDELGGREEDIVARNMEAGVLLGTPSRPSTCYICCTRPADAVIMECGHSGMCYTCAQHLAATPPSACPVCRNAIQQVLRFERVLTVRSGGSLIGGSGGGGGNTPGGEHASADELSEGEGSVVAIASSVGGGGGVGGRGGGGGGRRASSGSSFVRRFSAPDGAGPVIVAAASSAGARAASPPARDSSTRRGGGNPQGMSEEGGWLDPV